MCCLQSTEQGTLFFVDYLFGSLELRCRKPFSQGDGKVYNVLKLLSEEALHNILYWGINIKSCFCPETTTVVPARSFHRLALRRTRRLLPQDFDWLLPYHIQRKFSPMHAITVCLCKVAFNIVRPSVHGHIDHINLFNVPTAYLVSRHLYVKNQLCYLHQRIKFCLKVNSVLFGYKLQRHCILCPEM